MFYLEIIYEKNPKPVDEMKLYSYIHCTVLVMYITHVLHLLYIL